MAIRSSLTAVLLLTIGLAALAGSPAAAQCVGDCNGDGEVMINELIIGVNIALGDQPVSECPAFANDDDEVTIAQLILGVNNALEGCPAGITPTATPSVTPTVTPAAGNCTFLSGATQSHLELNVAALDNPLVLNLVGSMNVDCDAPGEGTCTCTVANIDPIVIPNIGVVCIANSPEPCSGGRVDCDGGTPFGVELRSNGNIGMCSGNDACEAQCDTACGGTGAMAATSGCTGYCSLSNNVECSVDADCLPDNGACNGPDPVGANFDICQCSCLDADAGSGGAAGELQCPLGVRLTVERAPPCDGGDVSINLGDSCIAQTTAMASTLITNANFTTGTVPKTGTPAAGTGAAIECSALTSDALSGLKVRGVVNFFGSTLGDIATLFAADCQ